MSGLRLHPGQAARPSYCYDVSMAKGSFEVECPCCQAILKIDAETHAVLTHKVPEKPKPIEDLAAEVAKLKGASGRREAVFQQSFEAQRMHGKVLEKKFDELFKQAKENPDMTPPKRDIDLD
ncbi:MAG: hypothetical protein ACRD8O_11445 [Bryobacteraceae bacterium]